MRKAAHAPVRAPSRTNVRFAIIYAVLIINEKPKIKNNHNEKPPRRQMNATASDQRERLPQFRAEARTARPARTAHPPAGREPPADGLPMTPRFLTETWRGETRILFSIRAFYKWRRADKSIPNRTLRPAGRPCGRERGFACCGGLCAWRVIARWLYRPFPAGFGRPGQAAAASDQRERFVQFRAVNRLFFRGTTGRASLRAFLLWRISKRRIILYYTFRS